MEIAVDENVCLYVIISGSSEEMIAARTGLRSLCMMSIECRYCNPFAASASFRDISRFED